MGFVAFDLETGGTERAHALQPFRATRPSDYHGKRVQGWITSYAIAKRGQNGELLASGATWPQVDDLRKLFRKIIDKKHTIVAWNAPFDAAWCIAVGLRDEVFEAKWVDAMLLYKHLTSSPLYLPDDDTPAPSTYGLKVAVEKFYPDEAGYEQGVDFADETFGSMMKLQEYNRKDCEFTLRLAEKFWGELTADQKRCALIEARCIPLIADTMVRGIRTDTAAAAVLGDKLTADAAVAYATLKLSDGMGVSHAVLASPKQLGELLYDNWGLPAPKHTPTGARATDKEALGALAAIDPRAKLVLDFREANGNKTKFADGVRASTWYNMDGNTRPSARIFGTYTGRVTYSSKQGRGNAELPVGVALHQWKRGAEFRRLIQPPEGYTLLEFDFAGQEYRWMAVESGDETMLGLCQPGEDAHSYMGARVAGEDYRKLMAAVAAGSAEAKAVRLLGKVSNLSLQYRTFPRRLAIMARVQHGVIISEMRAKAMHATYQTTLLGVPKYWERQINRAKEFGYIETLAGRRVHLGDHSTWSRELKWSYESTAINFPIQGIGADQKYLALAVLRNYLPQVDGYFYYELHDGMFVIVPDARAAQAAAEIKALLSNLPYKDAWGKVFPTEFPVDAKSGKSWGDLKEVK